MQVLLYLIDRAGKTQTRFPAVPTIGRDLHISISTIKRAMKELISSGYVSRESRFRERNGGQTSNQYTLFFSEQLESGEEKRQVDMCADNYETTLAGVEEGVSCAGLPDMERVESVSADYAAGKKESCVVNAECAADCDGVASDEEIVISENDKSDFIGTYGDKRNIRSLRRI